jgi:SAM-dependent methyltransferase
MHDTSNTSGFGAYGDRFYAGQVDGSLSAAGHFVARLGEVFVPQSVIDFGCGRGTWLKAFGHSGAAKLVGIDGPWNSQAKMIDSGIEFRELDLEAATRSGWQGERSDLAMSVEVAEHLAPGTEAGFAAMLCDAADVVLFGAAVPFQDGTHHVNLRWPSAWAGDFAARGYAVYDHFRPALWGHPEVPYWYQQNTFLYVRKGHALEESLRAAGIAPMKRLASMDCVHPELLAAYAAMPPGQAVRRLARQVLPASLIGLARRLRRQPG